MEMKRGYHSIMLLTVSMISISGAKGVHKSVVMYYHTDSNSVVSAGPNGNASNIGFGSVFMIDNYLTATPNPNSSSLGNAKGLVMLATGNATATSPSLMIFDAVLHSGSSIHFEGLFVPYKASELNIYGGTGEFRLARGFASFYPVNPEIYASPRAIECTFHASSFPFSEV